MSADPYKFDTGALHNPQGVMWLRHAVDWYITSFTKKAHAPARAADHELDAEELLELRTTASGELGAQLVAARPEMSTLADRLVGLVYRYDNDNLQVSYNALMRHARLKGASTPRPWLGKHAHEVMIDLARRPSIDDPQTLKHFFLAAVAANPAYRGRLAAFGHDDDTEYVITTPEGVFRVSMRRLIEHARMRWAREHTDGPHGHFFALPALDGDGMRPDARTIRAELIKAAGLSEGDALPHERAHPAAPPSLEELYVTARRATFNRYGVNVEYAMVRLNDVPDEVRQNAGLVLAHRGLLFVIEDALDHIPQDSRKMVAGYLGLWAYGSDVLGSMRGATRLMLELARKDGCLEELLDIFVTMLPHHYLRMIHPYLANAADAVGHVSSPESIDGLFAHLQAKLWKLPQALYDRYVVADIRRAEGAGNGGNGNGRLNGNGNGNGHVQLRGFVETIAPSAFERMVRSHGAAVRGELMAKLLGQTEPVDLESAASHAMQDARDRLRHALMSVKKNGEQSFGSRITLMNGSWEKFISAMTAITDDDLARLDRDLSRFSYRVRTSQAWKRMLRQGQPPVVRDVSLRFWDDVRFFIGDDRLFRAVRSDVAQRHLGWRARTEIHPAIRPLISLVRDHVLDLYAGRPLDKDPITGAYWESKAFTRFIETGDIDFHAPYTPQRFYAHLNRLLSITRTSQGYVEGDVDAAELERAFESFVAQRFGWREMRDVPPENAALVRMLRRWIIATNGGVMFHNHPLTGRDMRTSPMREIIRTGEIHISRSYSLMRWYRHAKDLTRLRRVEGAVVRAHETPPGFKAACMSAAGGHLGWTAMDALPQSVRPLVAMLRETMFDLFAGKIPAQHPLTGAYISKSPIRRFVSSGDTSNFNPIKFREHALSFLKLRLVGGSWRMDGHEPGGFERAFAAVRDHALGWTRLDKLAPSERDLVEMMRTKAVEVFGGALPKTHPVTGKHLQPSPLAGFIRDGAVSFNMRYTADVFRKDLIDFVKLTRQGDAVVAGMVPSDALDASYESYISHMQGLTRLEDLAVPVRPLMAMVRRAVFDRFAGVVPWYHPESGARLRSVKNLMRFIGDGSVLFGPSYAARQFRDQLASIVFTREDGDVDYADERARGFREAFEGFMAYELLWKPSARVPEHNRALLALLRSKVFDLFGGMIPTRHPLTEAYLIGSPVHSFIKNGEQSFYQASTHKFREDLRSILGLARRGDGFVETAELPEGFSAAHDRFATNALGWVSSEHIPDQSRSLTRVVRGAALDIFGGKLPSSHPLTGFALHQSKIKGLIERGELNVDSRYAPHMLRSELESIMRLRYAEGVWNGDGKMPHGFDAALTQFIAAACGWSALADTPSFSREMLRMTRGRMVRLFGGDLPSRHPLTGSHVGRHPIRAFVKSGELAIGDERALDRFIGDLERHVFAVGHKRGVGFRRMPPTGLFFDTAARFRIGAMAMLPLVPLRF